MSLLKIFRSLLKIFCSIVSILYENFTLKGTNLSDENFTLMNIDNRNKSLSLLDGASHCQANYV